MKKNIDYSNEVKSIKEYKKESKGIRDYRKGNLVTFKEIYNAVCKNGWHLITKELVIEGRYKGFTVTYYFEDFFEGVYIYKTYYDHNEEIESRKIVLPQVETNRLIEGEELFRIKELKTL